jgi:cytochrome c oxidase subunit 2
MTADDQYLRQHILTPGATVVAGYDNIMPTFQGVVSEDQLIQLIAYIKSLGTQPAQTASGAAAPAAQ